MTTRFGFGSFFFVWTVASHHVEMVVMAEEASWNVSLESQIREDGFKGALILIIIIILRDYNMTLWCSF